MSADKRKKILIAFASLAVVLGAVIVVVSPKFKNEDVIGAIGAVQKHRAPQITQADVVLGDEQTKKQQQYLYADFLADAASLQSAAVAARTESAAQVASRINAMSGSLRQRYSSAAREQIAGMKAYFASDNLAMKRLNDLETELAAAASNLRDMDIAAVQTRIANEFASLDAMLRARDLKSAEANVDSLSTMIESKKLDAATNALREAADVVAAQTRAASLIRARQSFLDAAARQASALRQAEDSLSAGVRARSDAAADLLGDEASALASRALVNMKSSLSSEMAQVDAMARMGAAVQAARNTVAQRANTFDAATRNSFEQQAESFSRALSRAADQAQAEARSSMIGQATDVSSYLASTKQLDQRAQARAHVAEAASHLDSVSRAARSNAVYASVLNTDALGMTHKSRNNE